LKKSTCLEDETTQKECFRTTQELAIIYQIIEEMIIVKGVDEILGGIIDQAQQFLNVEIVSIMLLDQDSETMSIRAAVGLDRRIIEQTTVKKGEGIAGWVLEHQEPLLVNDITKDKRFSPSSYSVQYKTTSLICVPIFLKNKFIGILNVNNKINCTYLTDGDLNFCKILATLSALALENARLFQEVDEKAAHLQQVNENLREVNKKLVTMDQRRTRFLSAIAHELNTPLTSIKGSAEMLERIGILPDKFKSFLQLISSEINRLIDLTSGLLDISRLYSKKVNVNKTRVRVHSLFEKINSMLEFQAQEKGVMLSFDLIDQELQLYVDPDKFFQVMFNLAHNAIKYSDKGTVVLTAWHDKSDYVYISVKDQGLGIPGDDLPHVFEEFYRVPTHQNLGKKGTGLGLALVKSIIDAHKGTIKVESEQNKGTCFTIQLSSNVT